MGTVLEFLFRAELLIRRLHSYLKLKRNGLMFFLLFQFFSTFTMVLNYY